jgi:hypothetical protein
MGRILFAVHETNPNPGNLVPTDFLTNHPVDSNLETSTIDGTNNAELTLRLKIFFEPVNSTDTGDTRLHPNPGGIPTYDDISGTPFEMRDWPAGNPGAFERFKREALYLVNAAWNGSLHNNGQLWLKTPDNFSALDWPFHGRKTHRPNVWCRFHAWEVARQNDAHLKVRVVRLRNRTLNTLAFSSDKNHWDSGDLQMATNLTTDLSLTGTPWFDANGRPVEHDHIPHEVGHALGQQHIGFTLCALSGGTCPTDAGYMIGTDSGANIMGAGTLVEPVNAEPFQRHIVLHFPDDPSNPSDWKAFSTRQFPRLLSSIPSAAAAGS